MLHPIPRAGGLIALTFAALAASSPAAAQAPSVEKVDPPNWWTGSTVNPVRVLVRGQNLAGARARCTREALLPLLVEQRVRPRQTLLQPRHYRSVSRLGPV